jgi:ABC-type uncharacterized transport system substrate-binding protein
VDRRTLLGAIATVLIAATSAANPQPARKIRRLGYLAASSYTASSFVLEAFRQRLRELGWVEGQNLVIDYRFAEGQSDRLPDLAGQLVRLQVDLIVATPARPALAARSVTSTIPIVMIGASDPVGLGLVGSLAQPGGNVTGLSYSVGLEIFGKQLNLLKEAVPTVHRVGILSNPLNPIQPDAIRELKVAARSLGLELRLLEARGPDDFDDAFATMANERVGALLVMVDPVLTFHRTRLAELAAKSRLPAAYTNRLPVEVGGLMSYGPSFSDLWRRAADYVDKILKGAKPAELPVEQPTKFELLINLRTAKALGLTIPQSLLLRADEVIQ